jgi:hypothetical protein
VTDDHPGRRTESVIIRVRAAVADSDDHAPASLPQAESESAGPGRVSDCRVTGSHHGMADHDHHQ